MLEKRGARSVSAVGEKLRQIRSEAQMTTRQGEEESRRKSGTSVSRNTISNLERGAHKPRAGTLRKLAWAYGGETECDPRTIMNLWRLELAEQGGPPLKKDGTPASDKSEFLRWAMQRDSMIGGPQTTDENRLEVIDLYLEKETSEARRRHLENLRGKVERGEYQPRRDRPVERREYEVELTEEYASAL